MNYFNLTKSPEQEFKAPVEPKTLNDEEEKRQLLIYKAQMTHTVPGMYQLAATAKEGGRKKGKRGNRIPRFPSVAVTSRPNAVFNMYKTATFTKINTPTTVETDGAYNFAFSQINDNTTLATVFDQYRIAMIEVTFLPRANAVTSFSAFNRYAAAVEFTDSTAVSFATLTELPSVKITEAFKPQTHTFVPRVASAVYSGAFTSFMSVTAPWLDVASPNVQHYGLKYAFLVGTSVAELDVTVRYHIQFRQTI